MSELWTLTAVEMARMVASGAVSATELVDSAAVRMAELEPDLHAFCTPTVEQARAEAALLDARRAAGELLGPLAGVPIAVKDLISTRGIRTAAGTPGYRDFVPEDDDIVVERVKAAGAIVMGKTNVSELGYGPVGHNPVFDTTRNPWNPAMTSGGSSAGSAVAVATGMSPIALGSDGGGSIRTPAALCGVVGVKASMGRVPLWPGCRDERYPGLSSWESVEHIGPIARTVADTALLLSVIAGPDPRDRHSIPTLDVDWTGAAAAPAAGLRIGFTEDWGYAAVDPQVRRVLREAVGVFRDELGCSVEEVVAPWAGDPAGAFETIVAADSDLTGMRRLVAEHGESMSPHLVQMVNREWRGSEFTDAMVVRKAVCNAMWRLMDRFDVLVTPTAAVPAFAADQRSPGTIEGRVVDARDWTCFTFLANLTGQPAVSVPAGLTDDGLPVGVQIIGRHLADAQVLSVAAAFEAASGFSTAPPLSGAGQLRQNWSVATR